MFVSALLNKIWIGPATTRIMKERKHQETRDGRKSYDPEPHSKEMKELNRAFGKMHAASSVLNLGGWMVMMWYGVEIARRLQ